LEQPTPWFNPAIESILLLLIAFALLVLADEVNHLSHSVGIKVQYYDNIRGDRAGLFKAATQFVRSAKSEVLVLNTTPTDDDDDDGTETERAIFYRTLLELTATGVRYERLLQVKDNLPLSQFLFRNARLFHFHKMLEDKVRHPERPIYLMKVPERCAATFVLIDSKRILWQIDEFRDGNKQMQRMRGLFLIEDPTGEIALPLRHYYEAVRGNGFGAVQKTELPELPSTTKSEQTAKSNDTVV